MFKFLYAQLHSFLPLTKAFKLFSMRVNPVFITGSTFENRGGKNNCWFNSVLQVIIHALQQHEVNMFDIALPPENPYESALFGMLKKFLSHINIMSEIRLKILLLQRIL